MRVDTYFALNRELSEEGDDQQKPPTSIDQVLEWEDYDALHGLKAREELRIEPTISAREQRLLVKKAMGVFFERWNSHHIRGRKRV